jgi:hypothetical protein
MEHAIYLLMLAGIAWAAWAAVRNANRREGECERCGYDLRASAGRCPECGEIVPFRDRGDVAERLRNHWPADRITPRMPRAGEERTVVHTTTQNVEAQLLSAQLVARGTFARVEPRVAGRLLSEGDEVRVEYDVYCWSDDAELAAAMARRMTAAEAPVAGAGRP